MVLELLEFYITQNYLYNLMRECFEYHDTDSSLYLHVVFGIDVKAKKQVLHGA